MLKFVLLLLNIFKIHGQLNNQLNSAPQQVTSVAQFLQNTLPPAKRDDHYGHDDHGDDHLGESNWLNKGLIKI